MSMSRLRRRILGLVGTNGAGRTTLLNILATLVRPTSGHVDIDGIDALRHPFRVRPNLGFVRRPRSSAGDTTVRELLDFAAAMRVRHRATRGRRSRGAGILRAWIRTCRSACCRPGRDSRWHLRRLWRAAPPAASGRTAEPSRPDGRHARSRGDSRLPRRGGTVVMACNRVADVEALCDEVAFFHRGRLLRTMEIGHSGWTWAPCFRAWCKRRAWCRKAVAGQSERDG